MTRPDSARPDSDPTHALAPEDALARLGTTTEGLDAAETARRLRRYGPNTLAVARPATALAILVGQLRSVVVLRLLDAAAVAFRCTRILTAAGEAPLDEARRRAVLARNERFAARGLRVLALARGDHGGVGEEAVRDLVFVALAGLEGPPAAGVRETVERFRAAGLHTVMITGDQRLTAAAVARQLGIRAPGAALEGLSSVRSRSTPR